MFLRQKNEALKFDNDTLNKTVVDYKEVIERRDEHRQRLMDSFKEHATKNRQEIQSLKDQNEHLAATVKSQNEQFNRLLNESEFFYFIL